MAEWAVRNLSYLAGLRKVFGGMPRRLMEAEPEMQERILRCAEKSVYGDRGLEAYEASAKSPLHALARRSLAQHLCQRALLGSAAINGLRRVLFGLLLVPLLIRFLVASLRWSKTTPSAARPDRVIFFWAERLYKFVDDCHLPTQSYVLHRGQQAFFGRREIGFFLRTLAACPRFLWYPELLSNFMRWLGYYGHVVQKYRPMEAVAHFFENTASCSLMTAYLHEIGLRHIDVQHGEIMFTAMSAFCRFDEVRLWGEHFGAVLQSSRIPAASIRIEGTRYHSTLFHGLRKQGQPRGKRLLIIDPFVYEDHALHHAMIRKVLARLDPGWEIRVRRHPAELRRRLPWVERLTAELESNHSGIHLEEELPSVPIEDALSRSRIVLGVASAALIEAWIAGCKIVHIAGGPRREVVMNRYQNSLNAIYCDAHTDMVSLDAFLRQPAVLDEGESRLVNHLTVVGESLT